MHLQHAGGVASLNFFFFFFSFLFHSTNLPLAPSNPSRPFPEISQVQLDSNPTTTIPPYHFQLTSILYIPELGLFLSCKKNKDLVYFLFFFF